MAEISSLVTVGGVLYAAYLILINAPSTIHAGYVHMSDTIVPSVMDALPTVLWWGLLFALSAGVLCGLWFTIRWIRRSHDWQTLKVLARARMERYCPHVEIV